ncbi:MAG: nucleotide sugar dehydrogenase, partial [Candidatus Magasanikbacteria bacterium CG10_big_fil_rev_8_21_14_0_10_43_6]
ELRQGHDRTGEVSQEALVATTVEFTHDAARMAEARCIIVAVPTPIDALNKPDLTILQKATAAVGKQLQAGSIVVYESTVYPGATEEVCIPILEKESGLTFQKDFTVGYSPERVNPGDKEHTIDAVVKVVAGSDEKTATVLEQVYGSITNTFRAASIRVAEAAKVIENTQRDVNIALMNELAMLFYAMDISIYDVLAAAETKWNFLPFQPGLVGGHCIGVDPYYLTYKAKEVGHTAEVILAGRGINDAMHTFVAKKILATSVSLGKDMATSSVVIFGITFKENIRDIRNSKVAALYKELEEQGAHPVVYDPYADPEEVMHEYGIVLTKKEDLPKADILIVAVSHKEFVQMGPAEIRKYVSEETPLVADIKHIYNKQDIEKQNMVYWTL